MTTERDPKLSKFMSFILRHKPDAIGLALDPQGWASVDEFVLKGNLAEHSFSREDVLRVIDTCEKRRFSLSVDGQYIRAAQGHSIGVDLGLPPKEPPTLLYHGTTRRFVKAILSEGLKPQSRQQVHLSVDEATAHLVGKRHGRPVVLTVEALRMHSEGLHFFEADNGVWLTDHVPKEFVGITSSRAADSATTSKQPKLSR